MTLSNTATSRALHARAQVVMPGGNTGLGSLTRLHITSGTVRDYRSAFSGPEERRKMDMLFKSLLARGILMTPNSLMALSTSMTNAEADRIISGVSAALPETR